MSVPGTTVRPAYRLYQFVWAGLDWLYPPQCGGCGKDGSRWCAGCQQTIQVLPESVCTICGRKLQHGSVCPACRKAPPPYSAVRSWAVFAGPLRNAIHRLKYKGDMTLADILAQPMLAMLYSLSWAVDLVVPVPIGASRRAERGYNQAALLALPIALGSGVSYRVKALQKTRDTRSQVGLSISQRRENVMDAFLASRKLVQDRRVLLVDDVMTSGATIEACTRALLEAGAEEVYGLTLAQAAFDPAG